MCSLHFRDGYPTPENPHPTELLSESKDPQFFRGKVPEPELPELSPSELVQQFCQSLIENNVMRNVNKHIDQSEEKRRAEERRRKEQEEKRRKELQSLRGVRFYRFTSLTKRKRRKPKRLNTKGSLSTLVGMLNIVSDKGRTVYKRRSVSSNVWSRRVRRSSSLHCRFCSAQFRFTKALYQHTRTVHVAPVRRKEEKHIDISPGERRRVLSRLYPPTTTKILDPKKKYVCAVCKSVCDLIGLFMHMKEVHHGLLCQFCLKLFKKVS